MQHVNNGVSALQCAKATLTARAGEEKELPCQFLCNSFNKNVGDTVSKGVQVRADSNRGKNLQGDHNSGCAFPAGMAIRDGRSPCLSDWNDNAIRKITNEMKHPKCLY